MMGLTSRLISGCTSRIELATLNGALSLLLGSDGVSSALLMSGAYRPLSVTRSYINDFRRALRCYRRFAPGPFLSR